MTAVSFALQHHPSRAALAAALAADVGGPVDVVADPDPGGFPSPWRCYRHALELTPGWATHRLVLQDDVEVCGGFRAAAEAAVAAQPGRLLSFYVGGDPVSHVEAVHVAAARDLPWAELDTLRWCPAVALAWPVALIPPLLAYVDEQNWPVQFRADDEIIGRFCREIAAPPLASVPSLVDHPDQVQSLVGQRAMGGADRSRVAACFIGDCDPATIDWTLGP